MSRAIVLISCLLAAAGVATYTYYSEQQASQTPVYTVLVPQRPAEPARPPPAAAPAVQGPARMAAVDEAASQKPALVPGDRASITRELQRELKRVGCYSGDINGIWTTSSRMAMKSFIDAANASLPIDNPDHVLLSLVQQRQDTMCVLEVKAAPADKEKSTSTVGAAVPAAAAAALAATAAATAPKAERKPAMTEDRPRSAAVAPSPASPSATPGDAPAKAAAPSDRPPRASGGPVPSEGVYERKRSRSAKRTTQRPPKFVRNFLRALGFR